jgi:hypothetical protein
MAISKLNPVPVKKRIERFTASGSFVAPAGVDYVIAHMIGGGGGIGNTTTAGAGGSSSFAFPGGTVSAPGGAKGVSWVQSGGVNASAGQANSGRGAQRDYGGIDSRYPDHSHAVDAQWIVAGGSVNLGGTVTVTVGAGGAAGTDGAAGGTGYVYIEYYL